jgi:hypothetical protein
VLLENCSNSFRRLFHVLIVKKHVLAVSLMGVILQMMSNSRQSSLVINAHLPIDQAGRRYCSHCREFEMMTVIYQQLMSSSS